MKELFSVLDRLFLIWSRLPFDGEVARSCRIEDHKIVINFLTKPVSDDRISVIQILGRKVGVRELLPVISNCLGKAKGDERFRVVILGDLNLQNGSSNMLNDPGVCVLLC